jgi:hypothetical protein
MSVALMANVDAWATANGTTRSAAIRRLLELGLFREARVDRPKAKK